MSLAIQSPAHAPAPAPIAPLARRPLLQSASTSAGTDTPARPWTFMTSISASTSAQTARTVPTPDPGVPEPTGPTELTPATSDGPRSSGRSGQPDRPKPTDHHPHPDLDADPTPSAPPCDPAPHQPHAHAQPTTHSRSAFAFAPAASPAPAATAATPASLTSPSPGPGAGPRGAPALPASGPGGALTERGARPRAFSLPHGRELHGVLVHASSSMSGSQSQPGTCSGSAPAHAQGHGAHKSVHFGTGSGLADVRVFKRRGRPVSVSRGSNRPTGVCSDTETETEEEDPSGLEGLRLGLSLSRALLGPSLRTPGPYAAGYSGHRGHTRSNCTGGGGAFSLPPSLVPLVARRRVHPFTLGLHLGAPINPRTSTSSQGTSSDPPVVLEGVRLSSDARRLEGYVRVQNLAFDKWVAVRYTFDNWATVSEVSATWTMSLPPHPGRLVWASGTDTSTDTVQETATSARHTDGTAIDTTTPSIPASPAPGSTNGEGYSGEWDRFHFTLRLGEMAFVWSGVRTGAGAGPDAGAGDEEAKCIQLAVHYTVAGQDYWDNNEGSNFVFRLVRRPLAIPRA